MKRISSSRAGKAVCSLFRLLLDKLLAYLRKAYSFWQERAMRAMPQRRLLVPHSIINTYQVLISQFYPCQSGLN
ncbi:hypothetical protein CPB84DRAFT_1776384, partial [Gymnopilus junonius]